MAGAASCLARARPAVEPVALSPVTPSRPARSCCAPAPRRSGAQHERAGRAGVAHPARPALPLAHRGRSASGTAILHGLARRTAPQTCQSLPETALIWSISSMGIKFSAVGICSRNAWAATLVSPSEIRAVCCSTLTRSISVLARASKASISVLATRRSSCGSSKRSLRRAKSVEAGVT